jgi:hypothetical protein
MQKLGFRRAGKKIVARLREAIKRVRRKSG